MRRDQIDVQVEKTSVIEETVNLKVLIVAPAVDFVLEEAKLPILHPELGLQAAVAWRKTNNGAVIGDVALKEALLERNELRKDLGMRLLSELRKIPLLREIGRSHDLDVRNKTWMGRKPREKGRNKLRPGVIHRSKRIRGGLKCSGSPEVSVSSKICKSNWSSNCRRDDNGRRDTSN
jgi:hypothetical protein